MTSPASLWILSLSATYTIFCPAIHEVMSYNTRFTDRVLLCDAKARRLLSAYVAKGLPAFEYDTMLSYLQTNLPCAVALVKASTSQSQDETKPHFLCKSEWSAFLSTLSSPSPVCAMIHPSERMSSLISVMLNSDITKDAVNLKVLQEEIPVIFSLICSLGYYPKEILAPLLGELSRVAFGTFSKGDTERPATLTANDERQVILPTILLFQKCG